MYKRVRRNYLKTILPLITAVILLCGLMLYLSGFGFVFLFKDPVRLEEIPEKELEGSYAKIDINKIEGTYAWYGAEAEDGLEAEMYERYCVYVIDEDKYLGVRVTGEHLNEVQAMYDAFEILGEDKAREMDFGTLSGTVKSYQEVNESLYKFLCEWVDDRGLTKASTIVDPYSTGDDELTPDQIAFFAEHVLPYILEVDYMGSHSSNVVNLMTAAAMILLLVALILVLTMAFGIWNRPVRKLVAAEGLEAVEKDYNAGTSICAAMHVGHTYTWLFKKVKTDVIKTADIIWAYPRSRRLEGGRLRWLIVLKTEDKREYGIVLNDKEKVLAAMEVIEAEGNLVTTGFDKKKQQLYDKDMSTFKSYIKKEMKDRVQAGISEELQPSEDSTEE